MTRQRYIPNDNQWVAAPEFSEQDLREAVYAQVGERFGLSVKANGDVFFDPDDLPSGLSENDVKKAVKDNHPHR